VGDHGGEAKTLSNIGVIYSSIGKPQEALKYHNQALPISREVGDLSGEATTLNNIGSVYDDIGKPDEALKYYNQALPISREVGDRSGEAKTLNNIGSAYDDIGKPDEALKYYNQALPIRREVGDRSGEAATLNNIGLVYDGIGKPDEALKYYNQALPILREVGDRGGEAITLNNIGGVYRDNNQPAEAIKNLEASLNIYLDMRGELSRDNRKQFLTTNQRTVITLAEILIQQNQPEKAFQWLNLATTADLADYNRLINAQVANPEAQKAIENWKNNNQQLEAMRQQLQTKFSDESARKMREFEATVNKEAETIAQKYPEVAELFETKPTDIAQLQQNIAPDTLVIQPVPLRDKIALFLLTKDKLTVIESNIKADEFNQLVNTYRNQLADRKNADYLVTSSQLYDILIRPIEQQIKTNSPKNLAIIATDQLRYIPFESLYDSKTEQYLLQKYPISYLTRISTANIPNSPSKTAKNLQALALANPKPTNQELKGTEKEAENLLKIFPQSETYLGEKATLDTFKTQASRFSILHLGTHGCFELAGCPNLKMEANTILFANNQQYNIADAALLGLKNTELITLSACQTAKEANANGQEISGLAYVLERAGAKSVIASLWNAEDNTSAEIMTQFYQNLQKGMNKSEAMQQAKLSQIKENPKPYFWSPFILIGDAQYRLIPLNPP
jgi:CHAT domain-containing protein